MPGQVSEGEKQRIAVARAIVRDPNCFLFDEPLSRLDVAIRECDRAIGPVRPIDNQWADDERTAGLRLNELAESARRFVWNELADWYLEASKGRLLTPGADAEVARSVLVHVFDWAAGRPMTPGFGPETSAARRRSEDVPMRAPAGRSR